MFQLPRAVRAFVTFASPKISSHSPSDWDGKGERHRGSRWSWGWGWATNLSKLLGSWARAACIDVAPSDFARKGFSFRSSPLPFSLSTSGHIFFTFMASILSYHTLVFAVRAKNSDSTHIPFLAMASAHSWLPGSVCASLLATGSGCARG